MTSRNPADDFIIDLYSRAAFKKSKIYLGSNRFHLLVTLEEALRINIDLNTQCAAGFGACLQQGTQIGLDIGPF